MDYQDRIVMISGGSSGIGLASAKALAAMGAHVFVFSLDEPKQIEDALVQLGQVKAHETQRFGGIRLDVTDQDAVAKELDKACREFGTPDVLINSAGIGGALPFEQISYERFDATVKVNLYGVRNVCAACLPHMRKAGRGGRIVNIASMAGLISVYGYTAYSAAKSAVVGFSQALRSELKPEGIWVSVLCPAQVDTPMIVETDKYKPPATKAINDRAGVMSAEDVVAGMLKGMRQRKAVIIPGFKPKLFHLIQRLIPGFRERTTDKVVRRFVGK